MSSIQLFDLNGEQRFTGTSVGGGGAQPQTDTATVTTDAATFTVNHAFDLGRLAMVDGRNTVLVLTADGETWGGAAGQIGVETNLTISSDGVTYSAAGTAILLNEHDVDASGYMIAPAQFERFLVVSFRYLRLGARIVYPFDGSDYAGPNHPTAQVRLDVEYL